MKKVNVKLNKMKNKTEQSLTLKRARYLKKKRQLHLHSFGSPKIQYSIGIPSLETEVTPDSLTIRKKGKGRYFNPSCKYERYSYLILFHNWSPFLLLFPIFTIFLAIYFRRFHFARLFLTRDFLHQINSSDVVY